MSFTNYELENRDNIIENIKNVVTNNIEENFKNLIKDKIDITLLGECTHGTEEFYKIRSNITKILIRNNNYRVVCIEAEWPDINRVNSYVQLKSNDVSAKQSLSNINTFPNWLWNNNIFIELIEWIKNFNKDHKDDMVYILGLDCQQFIKSYDWIKNFLKSINHPSSNNILDYINFLSTFKSEKEYANLVTRGPLKNLQNQIVTRLQEALSKFQWDISEYYFTHSNKLEIDLFDILGCEQSLEILVNAEEYYRKMLEEPVGSQASWNTRDQHMLMTIMRIRNRYKDIVKKNIVPKIVIWAHNSHIGNSLATNKGGYDFSENNTWNLGQMIKEMYPYSLLVGLYTYSGTVRAARKNDTEGIIQTLNKANYYSYEYFFHKVCQKKDITKFILDLNPFKIKELNIKRDIDQIIKCKIPDNYRSIANNKNYKIVKRIKKDRNTYLLLGDGTEILESNYYGPIFRYFYRVDEPLPESINEFLNCKLLQRWVGVHYIKETELQSHYGETSISHQYDAIIFFDKTTALLV